MTYGDFEGALLSLAFETDVKLSATSVAYHLEIPVDEATKWLEAMLHKGALVLDSDAEGNLFFALPGRPAPGALTALRPKRPQARTEASRRRRRAAIGLNALCPGAGSLLLGAHVAALVQGALVMTVIGLLAAFWKDFGDHEHRPWLLVLGFAFLANWLWGVFLAIRHEGADAA